MTQVRFVNKPVRSFNNLMDDLLTGMPSLFGNDILVPNGREIVPVNIRETASDYILEVIAPGFEKEDFVVNLENNLMTVSAEKKVSQDNEAGKQIKKEYRIQSFKRSFNVDDQIDTTKIVGKYINGVLTLNLPRKEAVKEEIKSITIQ